MGACNFIALVMFIYFGLLVLFAQWKLHRKF